MAATKVLGGDSSGDGSGSGDPRVSYTGGFTGQLVVGMTASGGGSAVVCESTRAITGTLTIRLETRADGSVTGFGNTTGSEAEVARTQSSVCTGSFGTVSFNYGGDITGAASSMTFRHETRSQGTSPEATTVSTNTLVFQGSLNGNVIAGTLDFTESGTGENVGGTFTWHGNTTMAVTLQR